ncbi:MAG: hypothetical protein QNJ14_15260 [Woeseiaceae bacterium]|nr:hypothetical protein [Woeseiaceae bacterium]
MKPGTEHRLKLNRRVLSAVALAILAPSAALANDASVAPFKMGVVEDAAYGRTIQSGNYEKAIAKISERGRSTQATFSVQNNLCVAYVKTVSLDKAADACDAALAEIKTREARALRKSRRSPESQAYRSDLSIALSNRGVYLAVLGDAEKARADFQAAVDIGSRHSSIAANNLRRLDAGLDIGN